MTPMIARLNKKRLSMLFTGLLLADDFFFVIVSLSFSYWFRFHSGWFAVPLGIPSFDTYIPPLIFIAILLITVMNANGLYIFDPTQKFVDQCFSIFKSVCITMLLVLAGTFFYREMTYSRSLIFLMWFALIIFLVVSRYGLRIFYRKRILPKVRKRIVIIGKPETLDVIKTHIRYFKRYGDLVGVVASRKPTQPYPFAIDYLGPLEHFEEVLNNVKPDEVILTDLEIPRKKILSLILESEKRLVSFKIVADLFDIMVQQFEMENIDGLSLIKIKESPLNHAYSRFLKRGMDILGSAIGIIILSPFLLVVAVIVKITSPGPIFFSQERVGEGGKTFRIYKFRTMCHDAEKTTGPVFAKVDDERCTKLGRALRRFNIDELPQFFNVLIGDMSLVGPRPERPHFVDQFKDDIPRYMSRHHVKAGITGWAQVNGLRQGTAIEERIKYDLYYLENWSLWLDLKILLQSLFALKNAY